METRYKTLVEKLEEKFNALKNNGISVEEEYKLFNDIKEREYNALEDYNQAVIELTDLDQRLNTIEFLFDIERKLSINIDMDTLNDYISSLIDSLYSLYDNNKELVSRLYETIYEVIKLELLLNGESMLLDACISLDIEKENSLSKNELMKLIKKDLEDNHMELSETSLEDEIRQIALNENSNVDVIERLTAVLDNIIFNIMDLNKDLKKQLEEVKNYQKELEKLKKEVERQDIKCKSIKRKANIKVTVLTILVALNIVADKYLYDNHIKYAKAYSTTTEEYNTVTGDTITNNEYKINSDDGVVLTVYDEDISHDGKRVVSTYKIAREEGYSTIDYLDKPVSVASIKTDVVTGDFESSDTYKKVEITTVDKSDMILNKRDISERILIMSIFIGFESLGLYLFQMVAYMIECLIGEPIDRNTLRVYSDMLYEIKNKYNAYKKEYDELLSKLRLTNLNVEKLESNFDSVNETYRSLTNKEVKKPITISKEVSEILKSDNGIIEAGSTKEKVKSKKKLL